MSTNPAPRPPVAGPPRPGAGAPGAAGGAVSFDPLKMLQKYKYVLMLSLIAGMVIGVGVHFICLSFFPGYKSTVLFECTPVQTEIQITGVKDIDEDEMARFMGTQVETIKGELVMNAVLADARLQSQAPHWYKRFVRRGNFDVVEAYEELDGTIRASAIPNTYLIQLSVQVGDRGDAAGLVGLVKDNYLRIVGAGNNTSVTRRKEQIRKAITEAKASIDELTGRKKRLVTEMKLNSIDPEHSAEAVMLRVVNEQMMAIQQQIKAYQVILTRDEAQLRKETPIVYDQTLRDRVDQFPQILNLKQQIINLKASLNALDQAGIGKEHRSYKQTLQGLNATERQLESTREDLLLQSFETRVDATRMALSQFQAQIADLSTQREALVSKLNNLTQTGEQIQEINRQIESTLDLMAEHETNLSELTQTAGLDTANRITVVKSENVPDKPAFPIIYIMVPAVTILIMALTVGILMAFEMLDQRVKSAADIAMIPRTPVLGIIPDAEEDPVNHASLGTVFSDSPNSVLAEHFRQLRTRIVKDMTEHGHKTLLVVGAMPGSGATSVTTNLALACESAGKRTLVIDTNFRRARIHTAFGLPEAPGLAEALAGQKTLCECIQHTPSGPDVLPAGARNLRVVERLGTEKMGEILARVASEYEIVLLDVAPAVVAGDALAMCAHADATMLVAHAMTEKRGQVARLKNELSDTRAEFLGVLVNGVKSSAGGYMRKNIRTSHQYHAGEAPQAS